MCLLVILTDYDEISLKHMKSDCLINATECTVHKIDWFVPETYTRGIYTQTYCLIVLTSYFNL